MIADHPTITIEEITTGVEAIEVTTNKIIMWVATAAHNHMDVTEIEAPNAVQEALVITIKETTIQNLQSV